MLTTQLPKGPENRSINSKATHADVRMLINFAFEWNEMLNLHVYTLNLIYVILLKLHAYSVLFQLLAELLHVHYFFVI